MRGCAAVHHRKAEPAGGIVLALQLLFWKMSESMGNHDSEIMDDREPRSGDARVVGVVPA